MAFVEFEKVSKIYHTGTVEIPALRDATFQVEKGEICVIVGASGAGKTTLLNILGGMDTLTGGTVKLDGRDISRYDRRQLTEYRRRDVGFVFQFYNLIQNLTALENVEIAAQLCPHPLDAAEVLREVGLGERMKNFPAQLSGGEQQRVAIARALAKNPKLLLCDEPTGALDYVTGKNILKLLQDTCRRTGMTVVIITHQMSVIEEICTRVAILDGGAVAEEGRVEDIFAHPSTDAARRLVYPGGVSAKQYPAGTRAVRVSFNGGTVYDPLIASLAIDCSVKVTILGADTRTIDGKAFGTMLLLLPDDPNEAAKALSYIRSQPNITAEEVEYHA